MACGGDCPSVGANPSVKFLADMGISLKTVAFLHTLGHDAVHLADQGLEPRGDDRRSVCGGRQAGAFSSAWRFRETMLTLGLSSPGRVVVSSAGGMVDTHPATAPNKALQPTPYCVRSSLAPASSSGSCPAIENKLIADAVLLLTRFHTFPPHRRTSLLERPTRMSTDSTSPRREPGRW